MFLHVVMHFKQFDSFLLPEKMVSNYPLSRERLLYSIFLNEAQILLIVLDMMMNKL